MGIYQAVYMNIRIVLVAVPGLWGSGLLRGCVLLGSEATPLNNMGSENTTPAGVVAPAANRVLIDWLSWTLKVNDPYEAIEISGLRDLSFSAVGFGGMGYKQSLRAGNVVVYFDGSDTMGCHVSMTGQGCRQFEAANGYDDCWRILLERLTAAGVNFTRLDLAIDNVDRGLDLDMVEGAIRSYEVRSRFHSAQILENLSLSQSDKNLGRTIYVGAKTSRVKIRFYDKAAQMRLDGAYWVRCELQCMAERAASVVGHILGGYAVGDVAVRVLNHYFSLIDLDDSNKSRCPLKAWWLAWLQTTESLRLTTAKAIHVIERTMDFVKQQYAPTLAMFRKYLGAAAFSDFVHGCLDNGRERLSSKHEKQITISRLIKNNQYQGGYLCPF